MERSNERVTSASSLSRSRNIFSSEPHLLKGKNFSTTSFSQLSSSPNNTSRGKSPSSSSRRTSFRRETSRTSVQLSPKKRMGSTSPILSNPRKGDLSPPLKFLDHRSLSPPPKFLDERPNFPPPITKEPPISPERRPRETPFRGTLVPRIGALSPERPMSEREFLLDSGSVSPTWVSTKDSLWQETKSKPREGLFLQERRAMSPPMKGSLVGGGERKKPFILDNNNNNSLSFPCLPIGEPLSPENNFLDRQAKMMGMTPVYSPPREIFTTGSLIEETTFEEPKTSTNIKKLKFKDVLQDPILLPKFKAFLSDEMADENFLFYQELEIYRNLDNEEERLKKSKQIHQTFFSDSSSHAFFCTAAEKQSMEELKGTTRMFEVIEGRVIMELSNLFRRFVSSGKLASALPSSSSPLSSPTLGKGGERYPPLVSPPSPPPPRLFRKSKTSLKPKRPNSLLTITFSKKKREKQSTVDVEGGRMSVWNEGQNELLGLRIMATNFYRKVDSYFSSFSPGLNDNCKEFHDAFIAFLLPIISPSKLIQSPPQFSFVSPFLKKMHSMTKYLITITDLLDIERGEPSAGVEKVERVEEIESNWVVKAEFIWKSSQWVTVLFKTGQGLKETLIESEIEELTELINEYLQYLKGTKEPLRRQILEKICFFLLSTHSLDPFNLFFGSIPSEFAMEKIFLPFKKSERRANRAGTLDGLLEAGWQESRKRVREQSLHDREREEENQEQGFLNRNETQETEEKEKTRGTKEEEKEVKAEDEKKEKEEKKQEQEKKEREQIVKSPPSKKSKKNQQQSEHVPPPLDYKDFLQALTRWCALKQSPDQVTQEVNSLFSLLSPSITCQAGCYVAAKISLHGREWLTNQEGDFDCKYVLFRLAAPLLPSDTFAEIFIDNLETKRAIIEAEELYYYHTDDLSISLKEERSFKNKFFESPLSTFLNRVYEDIKEGVHDFIVENGAKHDMSCSAKLNYKGLEELCRDRMIVENILESGVLIQSRLIPPLAKTITKNSELWVSKVPPMLFPPPHLGNAFDEIVNFIETLPTAIESEIQSHLSLILSRIATFKKRAANLKSGKLKNEMCGWWLNHIEKRVDEALSKHGFKHDSLPDDYLNTRPIDIDIVQKNRELLNKIIEEEGKKEGKYGVEKLVEEVVEEVYEKVDGLREEMEFLLEKKWVGLPLDVGWEGGETDVELEEGGEIIKRDHEYLVKMKEMDEKIRKEKKEGKMEKKELELSDVVPVAGLVMARFHVKNCELSTAIDHWEKVDEMAMNKVIAEKFHGITPPEGNVFFESLGICDGAMGFLGFVKEGEGMEKFGANGDRSMTEEWRREGDAWMGIGWSSLNSVNGGEGGGKNEGNEEREGNESPIDAQPTKRIKDSCARCSSIKMEEKKSCLVCHQPFCGDCFRLSVLKNPCSNGLPHKYTNSGGGGGGSEENEGRGIGREFGSEKGKEGGGVVLLREEGEESLR